MKSIIKLTNGHLPDPLYLVVQPSENHFDTPGATILWSMNAGHASRFNTDEVGSVAFRIGARLPRFKNMIHIGKVVA